MSQQNDNALNFMQECRNKIFVASSDEFLIIIYIENGININKRIDDAKKKFLFLIEFKTNIFSNPFWTYKSGCIEDLCKLMKEKCVAKINIHNISLEIDAMSADYTMIYNVISIAIFVQIKSIWG